MSHFYADVFSLLKIRKKNKNKKTLKQHYFEMSKNIKCTEFSFLNSGLYNTK